MEETVLMQGPIAKVGLAPLLQSVGIGRKTCAVNVVGVDGVPAGVLWLKSGHLLGAVAGTLEGTDAFRTLMSVRDGTFVVSQVTGVELPQPLGPLRSMLAALGNSSAKPSLLKGIAGQPPEREVSTGVQSVPAVGRSAQTGIVLAPENNIAPIASPPAEVPVVPSPPANVSSVEKTSATISALGETRAYPDGAHTVPPVRASIPEANKPVATPPREPVRPAAKRVSVPPPAPPPAYSAPVIPPAPKVPAPPVVEKKPSVPVQAPSNGRGAVLCIASAKGGVGKTTIALNTAVALARRGMQVLLVDGDPNGGISAAVNAQARRPVGALDAIAGMRTAEEVIVPTRLPGLRVVPAGGVQLAVEDVEAAQQNQVAWKQLLGALQRTADIVLVDCPGGAFGPTRVLLGCATHVLGVLQAEPLAFRVNSQFQRILSSLTSNPRVLGVVLNMFDPRSTASANVLQEACKGLPAGWVFDTAIPRAPILNEATMQGIVLGQVDSATAPAITWTFEQLAAEIAVRMGGTVEPRLEADPLF